MMREAFAKLGSRRPRSNALSTDAEMPVASATSGSSIFFAADPFHFGVAGRCRVVPFEGHRIKILSAEDLEVFKAMFDRTQDWADIEAMVESNAIDLHLAAQRLGGLLGDDPRVARLKMLAAR